MKNIKYVSVILEVCVFQRGVTFVWTLDRPSEWLAVLPCKIFGLRRILMYYVFEAIQLLVRASVSMCEIIPALIPLTDARTGINPCICITVRVSKCDDVH
ncbi:hypothetical protein PROFUN_10626 [Planoprotostelium fungivorum]|uniref:Uncharacterized protein n=1 Tax=Planoprotostelium fungivorum TaxID=1890364 RepID=A0A2P6ND90_9EUKA|nr:hypothetical protein PROFUN_10626 [Planoprotostelium fungivorum]